MDQPGDGRVEGILSVLEHNGETTVAALAERFDVSAVTIRKDLQMLERRSLLVRTRGGARGLTPDEDGSFTDRLGDQVAAKKAIARQASTLVQDGDVIALDSSTSAYYLALELLERRELVVITNSLRTASLLADESDATIVLMGGTIRRSMSSTVGDFSGVLAGRGRIGKVFLGLVALSVQRGILEQSVEEAETKRSMVAAAGEVIALSDSTKAAGFGLYTVAETSQVTRLITDTSFDAHEVERWRDAGVQVDVCEVNWPDRRAGDRWPHHSGLRD